MGVDTVVGNVFFREFQDIPAEIIKLCDEKGNIFHSRQMANVYMKLGIKYFMYWETSTKGIICIPVLMKGRKGFSHAELIVEPLFESEHSIEREKRFMANLLDFLGNQTFRVDATFNMARFRNLPDYKSIETFLDFGTYVLDLSKDEEYLFSKISKRYRSYVRAAAKEPDLNFYSGDDFDGFWEIVSETYTASGGTIPDRLFAETLFKTLGPENRLLVFSSYKGKIYSALLSAFNEKRAYWLWAGRRPSDIPIVANSNKVLTWKTIIMLKRMGVRECDLGGSRAQVKTDSKAAGIRSFKAKYGGTFESCTLWTSISNPYKNKVYRMYSDLSEKRKEIKGFKR